MGVVNPSDRLDLSNIDISQEELMAQEKLMSYYLYRTEDTSTTTSPKTQKQEYKQIPHRPTLQEEKLSLEKREKDELAELMSKNFCNQIMTNLIECKICGTSMTGYEAVKSHVRGRRHQNSMQLKELNDRLGAVSVTEIKEVQMNSQVSVLKDIPITVYLKLLEKSNKTVFDVGALIRINTSTESLVDALMYEVSNLLKIPAESIYISCDNVMMDSSVTISKYPVTHGSILGLRILERASKYKVMIRGYETRTIEVSDVMDLERTICEMYLTDPGSFWISSHGMRIKELYDGMVVDINLVLRGGSDEKTPEMKYSCQNPHSHLIGDVPETPVIVRVAADTMRNFERIKFKQDSGVGLATPNDTLNENFTSWRTYPFYRWNAANNAIEDSALEPAIIAKLDLEQRISMSNYRPSKFVTSVGLGKLMDGISFSEFRNANHVVLNQNGNDNLLTAYLLNRKQATTGMAAGLLWVLQHKLMLTYVYTPSRSWGMTWDWTVPAPVVGGQQGNIVNSITLPNALRGGYAVDHYMTTYTRWVNWRCSLEGQQNTTAIFVPWSSKQATLERWILMWSTIGISPIVAATRSSQLWPLPGAAVFNGIGDDIIQHATILKILAPKVTEPRIVVWVNVDAPSDIVIPTGGAFGFADVVLTLAANDFFNGGASVPQTIANNLNLQVAFTINQWNNALDLVYNKYIGLASPTELNTALYMLADSAFHWESEVNANVYGGNPIANQMEVLSNAAPALEYVAAAGGFLNVTRNGVANQAAWLRSVHTPSTILPLAIAANGLEDNLRASIPHYNLPHVDDDLTVMGYANMLASKNEVTFLDISKSRLYTLCYNLACDITLYTVTRLSDLGIPTALWHWGANAVTRANWGYDLSQELKKINAEASEDFNILNVINERNPDQTAWSWNGQFRNTSLDRHVTTNVNIYWLVRAAIRLGLAKYDELPTPYRSVVLEHETLAGVAGFNRVSIFKKSHKLTRPETYWALADRPYTAVNNVITWTTTVLGKAWIVRERGANGLLNINMNTAIYNLRFAGQFNEVGVPANPALMECWYAVSDMEPNSTYEPVFILNDWLKNGPAAPWTWIDEPGKEQATVVIGSGTSAVSRLRAKLRSVKIDEEPKSDQSLMAKNQPDAASTAVPARSDPP